MTDTVISTELSEEDLPRGAAAIFGPTLNAMFAPTKAFEVIAQRPVLACWPVLWVTALMVMLGAMNFEITRLVMRVGMIEAMAQRGQDVDADQIRTVIETMDRWAPVTVLGLNVFIILSVGAFAALIWMGASLMGGSTQFSRSFAVASVASVVHPLLATAFVTLVWRVDPPQIRRVADFMQSTPSLGLALLLDSVELSPAMAQVVAHVDVFNLWWMVVVVIGSERLLRLKRGAATMLAVTLWILSTALVGLWTNLGS
ncbi:MAG TPA: YIP1 family protein [Acidobacteriota bacterium]|nr:YIP1 family protein [Acidobacteriota bacterium]